MKKLQLSVLALAGLVFVACSSNSSENNEADTHENDAPSAIAEMIPAPAGAKVSFGNLQDGDEVSSPFKVEMRAEGITIQPAGELKEGTGHHHLLINDGPSPFGVVVPADATHIHFGKGQTETELTLKPGVYKLTLQFADGFHRSYGEAVSSTITIEVKPSE